MKKMIFAAFGVALAAVFALTVAGAPAFDDVPETKWYFSEVAAAADAGLMMGKSATRFDPEGAVTRAEIAAILSRVEGADVSEAATPGFPDVKAGDWFEKYIGWATDQGILKGFEDGTARPNAPVTRQQLAVMLARYADSRGLSLPAAPKIAAFSDVDRIADWAKDAAEATRVAGIFGGNARGEFSPSATATRAEVAALSVRFLGSVNTAKDTVLVAVKGKKTDFSLVFSENDRADADELASFFVERVKRSPAMKTDDSAPSPCEIVICGADRPEAREVTEGLGKYEYRVKVTATDGKVTVAVGYRTGLARAEAFDALFRDYFNGTELRLPRDLDITAKYPFSVPNGEPDLIDPGVGKLRDPFVLEKDGVYYMYGTGWKAFKNATGDLSSGWESLGRVVEDPADYGGDRWAPEVYEYGGKFYMFTTYRSSTTGNRGCAVFAADSPEGPFRIVSDGHVTPADWYSIDGTLYVDGDGTPWMVFVHEHVSLGDHVGRMAVARMSDDLTRFVSEPVELFRADDPAWAKANITDGPFIYACADGELLMIWSNDDAFGYCVAVARQKDGKIDGEWTQDAERLYSLDLSGINPGGHGMIFRGPDGVLYLSFHSPNVPFEGEEERPYFLAIREEEGRLIWD